MNLDYLLTAVAIVFLFLAGFNVGHPRVSFGWLGLALLALTLVTRGRIGG